MLPLPPPPPPLFFLYPLKISPGGKTRVRLHCKAGAALLMAFLKKKKKTHTAGLWGSLDPTPLPTQPPSPPCNTPPPPAAFPAPGGGQPGPPKNTGSPLQSQLGHIPAWQRSCEPGLPPFPPPTTPLYRYMYFIFIFFFYLRGWGAALLDSPCAPHGPAVGVYKGPGRNFWKVGKNLAKKKNSWGGRGRGGSEEAFPASRQ